MSEKIRHCRKIGQVDFYIPLEGNVVKFVDGRYIHVQMPFDSLLDGLKQWDYNDSEFEDLKKDLTK